MIRHLVLISAAIVCTFSSCPLDWAEFKGECLYFGHDRRDFIGCQSYCKNKQAYLATVDNVEKANFIRQFVSVMHRCFGLYFGDQKLVSYNDDDGYSISNGNRLYRYWVGGSDFAIEGSWRWLETGLPIGSSYTNWADGRPSTNGTNNCMMLEWVGDDLKWVDVECNHRDVTYICEKQMTS